MQVRFRTTANKILAHTLASYSHVVRLRYSQQLHRRRRTGREFCFTFSCNSKLNSKESKLLNIALAKTTVKINIKYGVK